MKKKGTLNNKIFLPDCFPDRIANSFDLERDKDILLWDFSTDVSETVKKQVEWLLGHIVKNIKDREKRRNQFLFPLKFLFEYTEKTKILDILLMEMVQEQEYSTQLISKTGKFCGSPWKFVEFCRRELFLAEKEPAWRANVWYVDGLNINSERYASGSVIQRFSFLDIVILENRAAFQEYTKYLFQVTRQSVGTIRIQHTYVREFLRYLEEKGMTISDINTQIVKRYLEYLRIQKLRPQSCNNKIQGTIKFITYLQAKDRICHFEISAAHSLKKSYPARNEIKGLDEKIGLLEENLPLFPDDLRVMSVILIHTGIAKGKLLLLKGTDFNWYNETSWMSIPETNRKIPIPDILHWIVIKYMKQNKKEIEDYLFLNSRGKRYTTAGFCDAIRKQCSIHGILNGEYVFKGCDYQKEFCKMLYRNGTSIQVIRDYMGYATDEHVREYVGWQDERISRASEQYFEQEGHSLGGAVLMAKHDKMNEINRQESQRKMELAIREIKLVSKEGRNISVSELSKRTGLSKGFFYKNEEVRAALDEVRREQDIEQMTEIRKEIKQYSLEKQNEIYKIELENLKRENEELRKENQKLEKALEKTRLEYLKLL